MFTVGVCGFDSNHSKPLDSIVSRSQDYTLLLVKTDAFFHVGDSLVDTPPNTIVLFAKHAFIRYGRRKPHYNDDWIHFDLTEKEDEEFLFSLEIPFGTPCHVCAFEQLTEYTRLITIERNSLKPHKNQILDSLMRTLLYSLASQLRMEPDKRLIHKHYETLSSLREAVYGAPHQKWTVQSMAQRVHMSPSYFQHLYKMLFDVSCMRDVIYARMRNARYYLRTSEISINRLAEMCGYANDLHFIRQFKKYEGLTPTQYRRANKSM